MASSYLFGQELTEKGAWCLKPPHKLIELGIPQPISSTIVRDLLRKQAKTVCNYLHSNVLELILKNNWYSN